MSEFVKIDEIVIDDKIYPRESPDYNKIHEYRELIEDGVKFPPITVNTRTMHLIDGYHRYRATKALGFLDISVEFIDIPEEFEWIEAIYRNSKHGLPLKKTDIKKMFEEYFLKVEGKIDPEELAERLSVSKRTIYRWIDELNQKTGVEYEKETHKLSEEDKQKIVEMYKSGNYTNDEIAKKFSIHPDNIHKIVKQRGKVTNDTSPGSLSNELTEDEQDVNIETYPGPPIPKPINDSDDDDFDDFNDLDDEEDKIIDLSDKIMEPNTDNLEVILTNTVIQGLKEAEENQDVEEDFFIKPKDIDKEAKKMVDTIDAFLRTVAPLENIDRIVNFLKKGYPYIYRQILAKQISIVIPNIHKLIEKLLER